MRGPLVGLVLGTLLVLPAGAAAQSSPAPRPSASPPPTMPWPVAEGTQPEPNGLPWREVLHPAGVQGYLTGLTAWAGGFAAIEPRQHGAGPFLWHSPDGSLWQRSGLPVRQPWQLVPFRGGLVLATADMTQGRRTHVRLWRSADGVTWRRTGALASDIPLGLPSDQQLAMDALVVADGRLVLIGRIASCCDTGMVTRPSGGGTASIALAAVQRPWRMLVWTSPDGARWTRRTIRGLDGPNGERTIIDVTSTPRGLLAIRPWTVVSSTNGFDWTDVAPVPEPYEWGGSSGLIRALGSVMLSSDDGTATGSGNRLGTWLLGPDGSWTRVIDQQPSVTDTQVSDGGTVIVVGNAWDWRDHDWPWTMVSTDGGHTWAARSCRCLSSSWAHDFHHVVHGQTLGPRPGFWIGPSTSQSKKG